MRGIKQFALVTVCVVLATGAFGAGTIDTSNATFNIGQAPANQQGTVIIEDCAPEAAPPAIPPLGDLGVIGTMTGSLRAFPGAGSGGGAFHATQARVLPAGTHNFASFKVDTGVILDFQGAATVNVTGDVDVSGLVVCPGDLLIRCGGDFNFTGVGGAETRITSQVLDIAVGGTFTGLNLNAITATGALTLTTHAEGGAPSAIELNDTEFETPSGVSLMSAEGVTINGAGVDSDGRVDIQAFGGDVNFDDGGFAESSGGGTNGVNKNGKVFAELPGGVLVEASGKVDMVGGSSISGDGVDVTVAAFGGRVFLNNNSSVRVLNGGTLEVKASTLISLLEGSNLLAFDGPLNVTAYGGDITVTTGVSGTAFSTISSTGGPAFIRASGSVIVEGFSSLTVDGANLDIRAHAGDFTVSDDAEVSAGGGGHLDARCGDEISVTGFGGLSGDPVSLSSGSGGVELQSYQGSLFSDGTFTILSRGPVTVIGGLFADTTITVVSIDDGINI
ncbi:MAG: hypothetical protein ACYS99_15410, partial [Planctomycetota bacterium]